MPTIGRGGAGNIQALEQSEAHAAIDLEANPVQTNASPESTEPERPREEPLYAHTGRGGAGNYYSPRDLTETGHFVNAQTSHIFGDGTPGPDTSNESTNTDPNPQISTGATQRTSIESKRSVASTAPTILRSHGRGGAGNLIYGIPENELRAADRKAAEDKQKEEQLKIDVEKTVQDTLAVPQKAKLPASQA